LRIAFRIDSGPGIGMGHLTRMSALADAFSEYGVESVFFSTSNEPIDYKGFDAIIADSYLLSDEYINDLNNKAPLIICYDDNALYTYSCDILVNANLHAKTLEFRFGEKKPELLLGGEFALLRREFWDAEPITVEENVKRILVTFGGTDLNSQTKSVIDILAGFQMCEIIAVFGPKANGYEQCKQKYSNTNNVRLYQGTEFMSGIMKQCDMAITAGGSTIYELAALGIPSIIIPQADNQLLASDYFLKNGLMKSVGWWADLDSQTLLKETESLMFNKDRRYEESELLKKEVNQKGAFHLVKKIMGKKK